MAVAVSDDARFVEGLRDGDEETFTELHVRLEPAMRRVARSIVRDRDVADEVVQETWVGVVNVVTMRDVEGYEAGEVCRTLGLSDANQRVLLHRARSKVRAALNSFVQSG